MYYYQRDPRGSGCFTALILGIIFLAGIIYLFVYFGTIILMIFLGIGVILGLLCSIYSCIKAIPDIINDVGSIYFSGNSFVVFLKKYFYTYISIIKFSARNIGRIASSAVANFSKNRFLSFRRWMYLALLVSDIAFGMLILAGILMLGGLISVGIIFAILIALIGLFLLVLGVSIVTDAILSLVSYCKNVGYVKIYDCFNFTKTVYAKDLYGVFISFIVALKDWLIESFRYSSNTLSNWNANNVMKAWYNPKVIFCFSAKIMLPIAFAIISILSLVITFVAFIPVYLINLLWILFRLIVGIF